MNLQSAIEELKIRRDQMKEQLAKIEAAIPVLEDLNTKYGGPIESPGDIEKKQRDKSRPEPISLPSPKVIVPRSIPDKSATDKFVCEECHCILSSQSAFDQHNELFHSKKKNNLGGSRKYACDHCEKRFGTKVGLSEHMELRHPKKLEKS